MKQRDTREVGGVLHYRCGRCRKLCPAGDFYPDRRTAVGLKWECKPCHIATSVRSRDHETKRRLNREHMQRARLADPEKFRARDRARTPRQRLTLSPEGDHQ